MNENPCRIMWLKSVISRERWVQHALSRVPTSGMTSNAVELYMLQLNRATMEGKHPGQRCVHCGGALVRPWQSLVCLHARPFPTGTATLLGWLDTRPELQDRLVTLAHAGGVEAELRALLEGWPDGT